MFAKDIAHREEYDPSEVGRTLRLAFLARDIVEAILAGDSPLSSRLGASCAPLIRRPNGTANTAFWGSKPNQSHG